MLVAIEPRMDMEFDQATGQRRSTGVQATTKDGERKWNCQVVASMLSRWDASRTDSEVLSVTVTCADDPTAMVAEGDAVLFDGLTVGVMKPEAGEGGRIRGGTLFWSAAGVRSRVVSSKS
jgi:hypothetical protein